MRRQPLARLWGMPVCMGRAVGPGQVGPGELALMNNSAPVMQHGADVPQSRSEVEVLKAERAEPTVRTTAGNKAREQRAGDSSSAVLDKAVCSADGAPSEGAAAASRKRVT